MFIDPQYMNMGLGKVLWQKILDETKKQKILSFTIDSDPNAEVFYLKMGGVKIGEKASSIVEGRKLPIIKFSQL